MCVMVLMSIGLFGKRNRKGFLMLGGLILLGLFGLGCEGGSSGVQATGTPGGTYTITVTGTSGSISISTALTLTVQ